MKIFRVIFALLLLIVMTSLLSCEAPCFHFDIEEKVIPPTCTEEGMTVHYCKNCDYSYTTETVLPKGHSFVSFVYAPNCENQGYTENVCECGYTYITNYVEPFGHVFEEKVTVASCDSQGYSTHTCKVCQYSYIDTYVSATGHSFATAITSPDCDSQGYTTYTCKCGFSYISDYITADGHDFKTKMFEPTCTVQGYTLYTCDCGFSYYSDYKEPVGHSLSATVTDVTCTDEGYTEYSCECGYSFFADFVAPQGHKFEKTVTMPTVSNMGYTEFSCECGFKYVGNYRFYSEILEDAYADNDTVIAKGIDISEANHLDKELNTYSITLDWEAIKAEGIEYVILKAGSTVRTENGVTKGGISRTFLDDYNAAKAAGLDVGVYFYTYAKNVEQIKKDAELLLTIIDGMKFEYPIYLDLEDESIKDLGASVLTEMCMEFFSILQEKGYYTGLYVNHNWLYNILQTEKMLDLFEVWYARHYYDLKYDSIPLDNQCAWNVDVFGEHLGMWQYTAKGELASVPEIPIDFNYSYKDYPKLIKELGFNGY